MDKCRICLGNRKNCLSIFTGENNIRFVDMIYSLTNIKILKDDGITDKICRSCRKSLRESHEFKCLIEQSNSALSELYNCNTARSQHYNSNAAPNVLYRCNAALSENSNLKKINFNNINDIKIEIDIDCKPPVCTESKDFNDYFTKGVFEIIYNDTVIKKSDSNSMAAGIQPVPVLEFLRLVKEEPDGNSCEDNYDVNDYGPGDADGYGPNDGDDDNVPSDICLGDRKVKRKCKKRTSPGDDYDPPDICLKDRKMNKKYKKRTSSDYAPSDGDDEYVPPDYNPRTRKYKKRTSKKNVSPKKDTNKGKCKINGPVATNVNIKPIYLRDLKLVYSCPPKKATTDVRKYKYQRKLEMCPHCGIMSSNLKNHILLHTGERSFKCDTCGKGFFTASSLAHHQKIHSMTKDFKCDQCIAAFTTKLALNSHRLRHTTERKHVCEMCSKAFKRRGALRRHLLMHNSASKNVMCELCNMSFYHVYGLRHHMRVHTGERPYNCEICSQPYSYKHDFNRHCFKKHGVFLKRRSVYVMNEQVLKQEKILMRDLMLRVHGLLKDDKPLNPFEGPQAALAFEQAVKALEAKQIPIDFQIGMDE